MANPWFRLYSKIITDPKIEFLSFEDQRHFVWLLCLKNEGYLDEDFPNYEMFERMIARKLGLQGEAFSNAKIRLMDVGLIDENWQPLAWEKLQFISDSDPTRAERQKRFREKSKQKQIGCEEVTDSNALRNGRVTRLDTDTDTDTDTDIDTEPLKEKYKKENSDFEEFWVAYPKKTAKQEALKIWKRKKPPIEEVLKALSWQTKTQQWIDGFMPNPTTYLNRGQWEDEQDPVRAPPKAKTKQEQITISARSIFTNQQGRNNERVIDGTAEIIEYPPNAIAGRVD